MESSPKTNMQTNMSVEGVMHGPYPNLPEEVVQQYLRDRIQYGFPADQTEAQFIADRESEHQHNQHGEAILDAYKAGRINDRQYKRLEENITRWWIGWRNPGEYEVTEDTL